MITILNKSDDDFNKLNNLFNELNSDFKTLEHVIMYHDRDNETVRTNLLPHLEIDGFKHYRLIECQVIFIYSMNNE